MNKPITIIGAGGAIANCLAPYLIEKNEPIRLLSRRGISMPGAQAIAVDVSNQKAVIQATKDSKVVIMLIGIEYRTATWQYLDS